MQPKKIYCTQCGAVIPPGQAQCPYCGSSYAPEAERAYMRKLDHVRSELDKVGNVGKETSRKEIGRIRSRVFRILAAVLLLAAALSGLMFWMQAREDRSNRREYTWKKENLPALDRMYEEGDYDALIEAYEKAMDEGHILYDWKHRVFCEYYESSTHAREILELRENGLFDDIDAAMLLNHELQFRGLSWRNGIPAEDLSKIRELIAPFENDLTQIFHASREDFETFDEMLEKNRGFSDYSFCKEYVKQHPEILIGSREHE